MAAENHDTDPPRRLIDGRVAPSFPNNREIKIATKCPEKWALVDLESGAIYGHDGNRFTRLDDHEASIVAALTRVVESRGQSA